MSKTITVPDIGYYPIEITINNHKYTLQPGKSMSVPDEVAALLDQIVAAKPQPDPNIADKQPASVAQVKALIAAAIAELPTSAGSFTVHATLGVSGEGEFTVTDPDASLAEVNAACAAGKVVWLEASTPGTTDKSTIRLPLSLQIEDDVFWFCGVVEFENSIVLVDVMYDSEGMNFYMMVPTADQ